MGKLARVLENRDIPLSDFDRWLDRGWFGVYDSLTGVEVTEEAALAVSTVYACIRVISEDVAKLPLNLYRTAGKNKWKATKHPYYSLMHDSPNPEMTAFEYRETVTGHILLRGNAYSQKIKDRVGTIKEIWPLRPDRMTVKRNNENKLVYEYREDNGRTRIFRADEIIHLRGLSRDGVMGMSPISLFRDNIGLAKAQENYAGRFFKKNATPDIAYKHPSKISKDAYERLRDSLNDPDIQHGAQVLEEGMDITKIGLSMEDSQFIESRNYQVPDICRIYRVQPHKVQHLDKATFSNIEHQALEYVIDTLMPWLVRWEQRLNISLLSADELAQGYYFQHNVNGLLRGDYKSRMEGYQIARMNGIMNADEIRYLEEMNPIKGGGGEEYWKPSNMAGGDESTEKSEPVGVENGGTDEDGTPNDDDGASGLE